MAPTNQQGVADALRGRDARTHANNVYGSQWLMEVRELWPASAPADDGLLSCYFKQKLHFLVGPICLYIPHLCLLPVCLRQLHISDTRLPVSANSPVSAHGKAASAPLPNAGPTQLVVPLCLSQQVLLASM